MQQASLVWLESGVHDIGISFPVFANQTIYIEGGAHLMGTISGFMAPNVTIRGRGILAGDNNSGKSVLASFRNITFGNINVSGPVLHKSTINSEKGKKRANLPRRGLKI